MVFEFMNGGSFVTGENISFSKSLLCGQAFRWRLLQENTYIGVAKKHILLIVEYPGENRATLSCDMREFSDIWYDYFDLGRSYRELRKLELDTISEEALEVSKGLRILRQDPWETIITFLLSSNNSIARIASSINYMSEKAGESVILGNITEYSFPTAQSLKENGHDISFYLSAGAGFRARYVEAMVDFVYSNPSYLESLESLSTADLIMQLQLHSGIGPKIANCIALFGYGRYEAFPIDVWIQRIADEYYFGNIPQKSFGVWAGYVQECLYYWRRNMS